MVTMRLRLKLILLSVALTTCLPLSFAPIESRSFHANIYSGRISDDLTIYMILSLDQDKITGCYYYAKYKEDLGLTGGINPDGSFVITEFTDHSTGYFEGQFLSVGQAKGEWSKLYESSKLPFQLHPIQNPIAYFVEQHISRYESFLRNQGAFYRYDESKLVRITADFDNDGLQDCAIWDSGGWTVHDTLEFTVFFRNRADTGYSKMTLILFNPDLDYILPVQKGMARVIRLWHNPPINGKICEEFITGEYTKKGKDYALVYPNGKLSFKDSQGETWLKKSNKINALPIKVEWCMLSDYLKNSQCDWKIF